MFLFLGMTSKQEMTVIDGVKACDPTKVSLQCEWCNRFFSNERGVIRHKAYCAWHPQRLKSKFIFYWGILGYSYISFDIFVTNKRHVYLRVLVHD